MDNEDKFEEWIEKSLCYRWLHRNSWYYYSQLDVIFTYLIISIGIVTFAIAGPKGLRINESLFV